MPSHLCGGFQNNLDQDIKRIDQYYYHKPSENVISIVTVRFFVVNRLDNNTI